MTTPFQRKRLEYQHQHCQAKMKKEAWLGLLSEGKKAPRKHSVIRNLYVAQRHNNRLCRHFLTFCRDLTEGATPVFHPTAFKLHRSTVFTYKRSVFSNCSACLVADEPISLVDSSLIHTASKYSWWHKGLKKKKKEDILTLTSMGY